MPSPPADVREQQGPGMSGHVTLLRPDVSGPGTPNRLSSLPADLLSQSASRLRVLALLYAAVYLLRQICHSLSEAESCGLVHRDIKPANIFLCRYGEEYDFVKVLDFGIVRGSRDPMNADPALTRENAIQG
ncbi:MAG: protein kinase, partial [Gemmatimonadales bacterium]